VENAEGKGTTVAIYLPANRGGVTVEAVPIPAKEVFAPATETILVVEDEPEVRTLICSMLEKNGYTVLASSSAEEAARVCLEHSGRVDVLLTDVVMPGMSGPDLARQLTGSVSELKVLYMSGHADSAVARHRIGPEAPFIQKPFRSDTLREKIREVLG
jgi:two-component system, cell cycle sensor histidine kinase and response regulator CckA